MVIRVEWATGPLRRATRPPLWVRRQPPCGLNVLLPKLGGKLPPRTGGSPVPPRFMRFLQPPGLTHL